jgi:hypothetical protein
VTVKRVQISVNAETKGAVASLEQVGKAFDKASAAAEKSAAKMRDAGQAGDRMGKIGAGAQSLASGLGKVTGVAAGILGGGLIGAVAGQLGGQLVDAIDSATARSLAMQKTFSNLPFSIDAARIATEGLVTNFDLAKAAVEAHRLGVVKNSEEYATLADDAKRLNIGVGELSEAIGKQSSEILNNAGILLTIEGAHKEYAKSLGISTEKLSEEQKAEAFSVVAKKKIHDAALKVIEVTDGSAAAVQRFKVELQNLEDETLAGELPTRRLEDGLLDLARAGQLANKHIRQHRMDLFAVEDALEGVGVRARAYADITGVEMADAVAKADVEWGKYLRDLALENKLTIEHIPELERYVMLHDKAAITTKKLAKELGELKVAAQAITRDSAYALAKKDMDALEKIALEQTDKKILEDVEKAHAAASAAAKADPFKRQRLHFEQLLMEAKNVIRMQEAAAAFLDRGTALAGMDVGDAAKQFGAARIQEEKTRQLGVELEYQKELRAIEVERVAAEVQGLETAKFDEMVRQAEIDHLQAKIGLTDDLFEKQRLLDEVTQKQHEGQLAKMRTEAAALNKGRKAFHEYKAVVTDAYFSISQAALQAVLSGEGGVKAVVANVAKAEVIEMTIRALTETARGVIALASPFTAALAPGHFAAAAKATATAAAVGAIAASVGAFSGGGGGASTAGLGATGGSPSSSGQGSDRNGINDRPIFSSSESGRTRTPAIGGGDGGGGVSFHFHEVIGSDAEEKITKLKSAMKKHGQQFGGKEFG